MTVMDKAHGEVDTLKETFGVDATEDEATFVKSFGTLGAGAYAHCRERMADRGEE